MNRRYKFSLDGIKALIQDVPPQMLAIQFEGPITEPVNEITLTISVPKEQDRLKMARVLSEALILIPALVEEVEILRNERTTQST